MTPIVVMLVMFAAMLHASWNAILRGGEDHLWTVTVMSLATTGASLAVAIALPPPNLGCLPYVFASAALQVFYSVFLASAYRHGDLSQVYPIVRGSVPLLTTLAAIAVAHQKLSPHLVLGVALISGGIVSLVIGRRRAAPPAVGFALATGMLVAAYVTIDALGVRRAGQPLAYAAWIFLVYGALMPLTYRVVRGGFPSQIFGHQGVKALAGGLASLISYTTILSALALGPLAPISALRETSVVFSALIGRWLLGEQLTARRLLMCVAVAAGAASIALG
jgi:drug/metabolite transporter (DMT)-like permease